MGQATQVDTRNQLYIDSDIGKIFVWNNRYSKGTFTNGTGAELTLTRGTLLGRVASSNKIAVMKSASTDGSQLPIGILAETVTIANGASLSLNFCVAGDVVSSKLIFDGTDTVLKVMTLSTDDNITKTYGDIIADLNIRLVGGDELTAVDNS